MKKIFILSGLLNIVFIFILFNKDLTTNTQKRVSQIKLKSNTSLDKADPMYI